MSGSDPSVKVGDEACETSGTVSFSMLELFTDGHFWLGEEVHFLGAVGPAAIGYNHESTDSGEWHTEPTRCCAATFHCDSPGCMSPRGAMWRAAPLGQRASLRRPG